jgi:hypothetical protein
MSARVEVLYYAGCPAYRRARQGVLTAMEEAGLAPEVHMVRVRHLREARALDFRGSPTVRIDGVDVDPEGLSRAGPPGLYSRSFRYIGRDFDAPPLELLRERIGRAKSQ